MLPLLSLILCAAFALLQPPPAPRFETQKLDSSVLSRSSRRSLSPAMGP
jgi:hypothetical protein